MGVCEVLVGVDDDEDEEPDDVESDEDEEPDDVLEGDVVVVVPDEPDEVDGVVVAVPDPVPEVVLGGLLDPGCSRATTMPMNAAIPVAAKTAARVRVRTRARARSLDSGVLG